MTFSWAHSTPRVLGLRIFALIAGNNHFDRIASWKLPSLNELLLPAPDRWSKGLLIFFEAIDDDLRASDQLALVRLGCGGNVPVFRRIPGMRAGDSHRHSPEFIYASIPAKISSVNCGIRLFACNSPSGLYHW